MSSRTPVLHRFRDLRVATKVLAAVGVASLVAVLVGVIGLLSLSSSSQQTQDMYRKQLIGTQASEDMRAGAFAIRLSTTNLALSLSDADRQEYAKARQDARAAVGDAAKAFLATSPSPRSQRLARDVLTQADAYLALTPQLDAAAASGRLDLWTSMRDTQLSAPITALTTDLDALSEASTTTAQKSADTSARDYRNTRTQLVALIVVGLAVATGVGLAVTRAIVGGLRKVQDVTEALAEGDLTRSAGVASRDEVGRMAASLDAATESLRQVMTTVGASADAVAASSEELSASSAQISASAEETSVQSGVVSGAADEVSRSVQTVAAGAEQMGASIREIATNANEAARVAARAVDVARSTTSTVTKLGDSSREIGAVVKAITSIAEQTNLLALNATIEAARAGEAGKGFAVVANEVKELAQETARATEDIAKRVEAIQADTGSAVAAIEEISVIIGSINDYQTTIASAVEEQTATTQEMSRSVAEAAGGSGQIADNITGVATAADSTTQALTQTRTAVDELSRMAAELRSTVARFTH